MLLGLFLLSILLFVDTIFYDKYPVTSADPAIKYWSAVYNANQIHKGEFPLWNSRRGLGQSVYFNSILEGPFSATAIFLSLFENKGLGFTLFIWLQVLLFLLVSGLYLRNILFYRLRQSGDHE